MNIFQIIADELNVKTSQVESAVKLIDDGNTIPFIARYRNYLRNLETRKEEVRNSIEEQGKLTDEIVKALENAQILAEVEDIYRPYKQKKRTRAIIAKEKGLEPLADALIKQDKIQNPNYSAILFGDVNTKGKILDIEFEMNPNLERSDMRFTMKAERGIYIICDLYVI